MYQFSMSWFQKLFNQTFSYDDAAGSDEEEKSQNESEADSMPEHKRRNRAGSRMPNQDMTKK